MRTIGPIFKLIITKCDIGQFSLWEPVWESKVQVRTIQHWFRPFWIFKPSTRPVLHSTLWWEPQIEKILNLDPSPILTMPNLNSGFTNSISTTVGWRCFRISKNNVAIRDWCFTFRICLSLYLRERERERERDWSVDKIKFTGKVRRYLGNSRLDFGLDYSPRPGSLPTWLKRQSAVWGRYQRAWVYINKNKCIPCKAITCTAPLADYESISMNTTWIWCMNKRHEYDASQLVTAKGRGALNSFIMVCRLLSPELASKGLHWEHLHTVIGSEAPILVYGTGFGDRSRHFSRLFSLTRQKAICWFHF